MKGIAYYSKSLSCQKFNLVCKIIGGSANVLSFIGIISKSGDIYVDDAFSLI